MKRYLLFLAAVLAGCTAGPISSGPDAKNRVVDIVNTGDTPLQFTARNAQRKGLSRPASITGEVAANYYLTLNFDDGSGACIFDFSAEFISGQTVEAKRFDVCSEVSWVVGP